MGDYQVAITVPAGQVFSSTGVLMNSDDVLTPQQRKRLASARGSEARIEIVTGDEADHNRKLAAGGSVI